MRNVRPDPVILYSGRKNDRTDSNRAMHDFSATGLMRQCELNSCQQPKHAYKKTKQEHKVIPNALDREFDVTVPDKVWCGDVTYIWTGKRGKTTFLRFVIGSHPC